MPDLVIKGMALPKTICGEPGYVDVRIFADGSVIMAKPAPPYYGKFEAAQLPKGHGDLVDVKELLNDKEGLRIFKGDFRLAFDRIIERANTVVPAEGGVEE